MRVYSVVDSFGCLIWAFKDKGSAKRFRAQSWPNGTVEQTDTATDKAADRCVNLASCRKKYIRDFSRRMDRAVRRLWEGSIARSWERSSTVRPASARYTHAPGTG